MELKPGTYTFGPGRGNLVVKTGRAGAAFLVGKNLTIEVTDWEGKLEVGEDPSETRVELTADGGSLEVTDGKGGPLALTDPDKKSLTKTVSRKVLEGTEIKFHSETARPSDDGSCIYVAGELQLFDETTSLEFRLTIEEEGEDEDDGGDEDAGSDEGDEDAGSDDDGDGREDDPGGEADSDEAESRGDGEGAEGEAGDDSDDDEDSEDDTSAEREQRVSATAVFKQTELGLEPHSTLLGLLRARDEVEVIFEGTLEK